MKRILAVLIAMTLLLAACENPGIDPLPSKATATLYPTETQQPRIVDQSAGTNGGSGVEGAGTGVDLTVSPDMLATSQAAFEKANRTGPEEINDVTPVGIETPGPEVLEPQNELSQANPTITSTQYLSPNNSPADINNPTITSTQYLSPNNSPAENDTPILCGGGLVFPIFLLLLALLAVRFAAIL